MYSEKTTFNPHLLFTFRSCIIKILQHSLVSKRTLWMKRWRLFIFY